MQPSDSSHLCLSGACVVFAGKSDEQLDMFTIIALYMGQCPTKPKTVRLSCCMHVLYACWQYHGCDLHLGHVLDAWRSMIDCTLYMLATSVQHLRPATFVSLAGQQSHNRRLCPKQSRGEAHTK